MREENGEYTLQRGRLKRGEGVMSQQFKETQRNAITESGIARVIPCKELDSGDPIKWLSLGLRDFIKTPAISLFYGVLFAVIPWFITYMVQMTGWHLVIMPAIVCFMLIGPFLAAGLYDVSWELEKGHKPTIRHSLRAMKRNAVHEWGFGILLMVLMMDFFVNQVIQKVRIIV